MAAEWAIQKFETNLTNWLMPYMPICNVCGYPLNTVLPTLSSPLLNGSLDVLPTTPNSLPFDIVAVAHH